LGTLVAEAFALCSEGASKASPAGCGVRKVSSGGVAVFGTRDTPDRTTIGFRGAVQRRARRRRILRDGARRRLEGVAARQPPDRAGNTV